MTTKRNSLATPGQRSIATFFAPCPATTPSNASSTAKQKSDFTATQKSCLNNNSNPRPAPAKVTPPLSASVHTKLGSAKKSQEAGEVQGAQGGSAPQDAAGASVIGQKVQVFWDGEGEWFSGEIVEYDGINKHRIAYNDGDEDWYNLANERVKFEPKSKTKPSAKAAAGHKRKQVVLSESDDLSGEVSASDDGSDWGQAAAAQADEEEDEDDEAVSMEDPPAGSSDNGAKAESASRKRKKPALTNGRGSKSARQSLPAKTPGRASAATPATHRKPPAGQTPATGGTVGQTTAARNKATLGQLTSKLEKSNSTPLIEVVAGGTGKAIQNSDTDRYAARAADRFTFLRPDKIMDSKRRRPDHPDYDAGTLYIPDGWFKANKISEGQQQWWEFKAKHFDSTMLFKMGKFYEMFEMDAHVGVEVLGLIYMKGEQPHCGFPEKNYHRHAERLARAGLKVVVVEQTETPDQLRIRNEQRKANKQSQVKIVNRELVAVLTQATLTDAEMLQAQPDAAYLLTITEQQLNAAAAGPVGLTGKHVRIGICAVDVATARFYLGQWDDDDMRTGLRGHLAALMPQEIILPRGRLSSTTAKVLKAALRQPRQHQLPPGKAGFWESAQTVEEIKQADYFKLEGTEQHKLPPALQTLVDGRVECETAVSALGGCISHLRSILLDKCVVPVGQIELLPGCVGVPENSMPPAHLTPRFMALDGAALESLEVLESSSGGRSGSLMGALDQCCSPAGKRLLSQWLCRPLLRIADIRARQDAVQALMAPDCAEAVGAARKALSGIGDLERALARLHAAGLGGGMGRDAMKVVLYEDNAKRRVGAMIAGLRGLQTLNQAVKGFTPALPSINSSLLQRLLTPGQGFPELDQPLGDLEGATDWEEAAASGRAIPTQGVDKGYDASEADVAAREADLAEYLEQIRRQLRAGKELCYVTVNKDANLLEIPQALQKSVPHDFELMGQRKGFVRYTSAPLQELVKQHADALQNREAALAGILQGLLAQFARHAGLWQAAVKAMAELDALMALAYAAQFADDGAPMCRPTFAEPDAASPSTSQVFQAEALRHPAAGLGLPAGGSFVPNDICLGGASPAFLVLTGPNMGGKSTLLRQVCLAALMAQVGAWVPAQSLTLTPVDAIFVRMGAKDDLMAGQSTFFVELAETAAALNRATPASLVALDELGRGTATSDGAAIAAAVLQHLSGQVRCRGLFATHYHRLADAHEHDASVAICHMGCSVEDGIDGGPEQVTFLYRLTDGSCPKSYGVNVARLAGLPDNVVMRASSFASQLEAQHENRIAQNSTRISYEELKKVRRICSAVQSGKLEPA